MKTVPLKAVCVDAGQYGLNVSSDDYATDGTQLLRTSDLSGAQGAIEPVFVLGPIEQRHRLTRGDLLLTRSGSLGLAHLVTDAQASCTFAGFLVRFRPRADTDSRWLYYVSQSLVFQQAVAAEAVSSTISNFNAERYSNLRVPFVNITQQRRIADFLDDQVTRLDAAGAQARAALERAEERAAAAVHAAVTGHGFDQRQESPLPWAPTLPSHWSAVKLGLVARMGTGHTPSRSDESLWVNCTIPWLTTNDVHRFRRDELDVLGEPALTISEQGLAQSAAVLHSAGTVALSRTASAGYSVLMGRDMATSQDFVTWRCGPNLRPSYLLAVLRASRSDLLGRLAMGSTHKTIYFPGNYSAGSLAGGSRNRRNPWVALVEHA